jgi:hypothetical protein
MLCPHEAHPGAVARARPKSTRSGNVVREVREVGKRGLLPEA